MDILVFRFFRGMAKQCTNQLPMLDLWVLLQE